MFFDQKDGLRKDPHKVCSGSTKQLLTMTTGAMIPRHLARNASIAAVLGTSMAAAGLAVLSSSSTNNLSSCEAVNDNDRLSMWKMKWESSKSAPRWHKSEVNPTLAKHMDVLVKGGTSSPTARVLVPLCGKTVDMAFLAKHDKVSQVVGVEGIQKACEEFAEEHKDLNLEQIKRPSSTFLSWRGNKIMLLQGDFFELDTRATDGQFDGVWDRAALVAIEPAMRKEYVDTLGKVIKRGGHILLSTYVRRSGDTTKGPPYSIDEDEVRRLFESQVWVKSVEVLDVHSAFAYESWLTTFMMYLSFGKTDEKVFLITAK